MTTTRKRKGKEYHAHLLMRSYREGGKVKKRTVMNLTPLGDEIVELVRAALQGKDVRVVEDVYGTRSSKAHGHVLAVLTAMRRLGMADLLASRPSKDRSLVLALIARQVLDPSSKLATARSWGNSTLAEELGVQGASEDDLYSAMDWLVTRKSVIESKLAARHLREGGRVYYDLTSSYVEGEKCELAAFGYSRDKKRGKKQINWGLITDEAGRPIGVEAFPGNTTDSRTLLGQVRKVKETFGLTEIILVNDRGMITKDHIQAFTTGVAEDGSDVTGVSWITALKSEGIRSLVSEGVIQPSLFERTNLFEFVHVEYPGERLVACFNPLLARKRAHKREELLTATVENLEKIQARVTNGRLKDPDKIGLAVGKVLGKHKMGKHISLDIGDAKFAFEIDADSVAEEAKLDGIYVIRSSVADASMSAGELVLAYKRLAQVEQAFRTMKGLELQVRPIRHRLEDRVTTHLFITMLAYYVRWHMEKAWAPLTFRDEEPDTDRDPVAPAQRSPEAKRKTNSKKLPDGEQTSSFKTLLDSLQTIQKNTNYIRVAPAATFTVITDPNPQQQKALILLGTIGV